MGAASAYGVQTPYSDTPSAIVANDGLLWDNQFAGFLQSQELGYQLSHPGGVALPQIVWVADFCYSGGFVNNLVSDTNTVFAAAAADWDETSTGSPNARGDIQLYGQTFMNTSMTSNLSASATAAFNAVNAAQNPVSSSKNNGGNLTLDYHSGDQAVLFSSGDAGNPAQQTNFWNDMTTTDNALINRANNPWPQNAIKTYFDQGQTTPNAGNGNTGGAFVSGASTITNLEAGIANAYNAMQPGSKLFLYMNDHGTNTDVVKSKVASNGNGTWTYSYETDVANWRPNGTTGDYGIWDIDLRTKGLTAANILSTDVSDLPAGWQIDLTPDGGTIEVRTTVAGGSSTSWLVSGTNYDFSFVSNVPPAQNAWATYQSTTTNGNYDLSDLGTTGGGTYGQGFTVYDASPAANGLAPDNTLWPGWQNGGDGFIFTPVPEPGTASLLALGMGAMSLRRRTRRD
jgi:hypothetical protein